jgi:FkbM family methyltransferase
MRKILIDVGAHTGNNINKFLKSDYYSQDFEIFAFECNEGLIKRFKTDCPVTLIEKAAWTYDGEIKFFIGNPLSSSILIEKKTGNLKEKNFKIVDCVDLSIWIKNNFSQDDFIILLMDVEGAEYDIIDKMELDGTLSYINDFYLEFHGDKLRGFNICRQNDMMDMLIKKFDKNVFIERHYQHDGFKRLNDET